MSISASYPTLRPTLLLDFANSGRLDPRVTFTRASTATYFDETGVLRTAANDTPRFDYDPATLAARGLLIEEQRTNILLQSGWAGAVGGSPGTAPTSWTIGFGTGADTTLVNSIYGTAEQAVKFDADATERIMYQQIINVTSGVQYAASVFIEAVSGQIKEAIAVTAGTATFTVNQTVSDPSTPGRYTYLFTANSTGTLTIRYGIGTTYAATGTCSVTMSRPQVEAGAFPTSYIPTTTIAATRSADAASVNTLSPWYNATEGTLYVEASPQASNVATMALADINNGTVNERVGLFKLGTTGNAALIALVSGSVQGSTNSGAWTATGKLAGAYKLDDFASSLNGSAAAIDPTGTIPTVTQLNLGRRGDGGNILTGHLRRFTYYPRRLSNAELVSITA